jgi:hypothetical protein
MNERATTTSEQSSDLQAATVSADLVRATMGLRKNGVVVTFGLRVQRAPRNQDSRTYDENFTTAPARWTNSGGDRTTQSVYTGQPPFVTIARHGAITLRCRVLDTARLAAVASQRG